MLIPKNYDENHPTSGFDIALIGIHKKEDYEKLESYIEWVILIVEIEERSLLWRYRYRVIY